MAHTGKPREMIVPFQSDSFVETINSVKLPSDFLVLNYLTGSKPLACIPPARYNP